MALNFNVDPYYDDFSNDKNFHRILFKPGYAVQARELTQSQTILQDQITKFADHVFKKNSSVNGGTVTSNLNVFYVKLQQTYNGTNIDVSQFLNKNVSNSTGLVVAKVIAIAEPTGGTDVNGNYLGDPPTLILSYFSGDHFQDNETIYDTNSNLAAQSILTNSTGNSSVSSIDDGVFYVDGNFVQVSKQTTILSKYNNTPNLRVGLLISETIVDYVNDPSLLDPALGASNYQAPGADRYQITLTLTTRPLQFGDDDAFIELVRFENGQMFKMVDGSVYSTIDDYFAKRTYETNGDYTVTDFTLTPKVNPDDDNTYIMSVGKGIAYVKGYRVENPTPINVISNKSRAIQTQNTTPVYTDFGSFFYVDNVHGANGYTFDVTTTDTVDLHCVPTSNVNISTSNTYTSTLIGTANVRGLYYSTDSGSSLTKNWVYKMYISDVQTTALSGNLQTSSGNTNIVILPNTTQYSTINGAYVGLAIKLTDGTDAGETRTVASYNGSSKIATVDTPWSVATDATTKFTLLFSTKSTESLLKVTKPYSYPLQIRSSAAINSGSKVNGLASGDTILENPLTPELIFPIGYPYVSHIYGTSYSTYQEHRSKQFSGSTSVSTTVSLSDYNGSILHIGQSNSTLSSETIKQNFTIIVTNPQSNATLNVGDIINWSTTNTSIAINSTRQIATLTTTQYTAFTADIIVKVSVSDGDNTNYSLKTKSLVTANSNTAFTTGTQVNTYTFVDNSTYSTGQVYIQNSGIVSSGTQSLYLSDVKRIVKIIDTKDPTVVPTTSMISDANYNITSNYYFDNGQRDNFYDHASITLKPGAPHPKGNLLVLLDYYKHGGGDGYFNKLSYVDESSSPEQYREIGTYTSTYGNFYSLRDCLDFRPSRLNAQSDFAYRYSNPGDTTKYGNLYPIDLDLFYCTNYSYYLSRKDKLIVNKDKEITIIEGTPSLNPIFSNDPDGSLVLANITHKPYTGYLPTEISGVSSDLSIIPVQHKRYTMKDISDLDSRVGRVEYYTSLNLLEQSTSGMQIQDANGLNRFKNGILVDDFSGFATSDTLNPDYRCNVNARLRQLSAAQGVNNYSLNDLLMSYNMNNPSSTLLNSLDYAVRTDGTVNSYLLPYTETEIASQKLASRYVNVNPFAVTNAKGIVGLSPNADNWVDNKYNPSILITAPGLQIFSNTLLQDIPINLLSVSDWQTISSTKTLVSQTTSSTGDVWTVGGPGTENAQWISHADFDQRFGGDIVAVGDYVSAQLTKTTTLTSTYNNTKVQEQDYKYGPYSSISNTYSMNNGFVTDVSILPYIRKQEVTISVNELLVNTKVSNYFDDVNVDMYVKKPNTIELTNVVGEFHQGDMIGYKPTPTTFIPTAQIIGVFYYYGSTNVRLYVTSDGFTNSYDNGTGLIYSGKFDQNGLYVNSGTSGTYSSYTHNSGVVSPNNYTILSLIYPSPIGWVPRQITSNQVVLSGLASSTDGSYVGQTLFINAGTGAGNFAKITAYTGLSKLATLDEAINFSWQDAYSIGSSNSSDPQFRTNESGNLYGIFCIPENKFQTGQRIYRVDDRINNNINTTTTWAEGTFYASGLQATKQRLDFGAAPASYEKQEFRTLNWKTTEVTSNTDVQNFTIRNDPVAQSFIIDSQNYPNGAFLSSIKTFFRNKPQSNPAPVSIRIVGTNNGYPDGNILPNSYVSLHPNQVKTSDTPHNLDANTYTNFEFPVPVFIQPDTLYAFILKSDINEYEVWTALNSDPALPSSVKNLPSDPTPSVVTKITKTPYIGNIFLSQNSQTWTADQNQSMMFVMNRSVFDVTKTPSIRFVTPKGLPQRKIIEQSIQYFNDANNITTNMSWSSNNDVYFDAFNLSTTDLIPSRTDIKYSYNCMLPDGSENGVYSVDPGKYATTMYEHVYLNDGRGERALLSNTTTSFSMYAQMTSTSDTVSPVISESGTTLYTIKNLINNCEMSNSLITLANGGSGYMNASNIMVTISAPTGKNGVQAYAKANVNTASGMINSVYLTYPGSGYVTTPTITITDTGAIPGSGVSVNISGETSSSGGPAYVKYFTKKVVLDQGFDSGDLNVFLTAYRPLNTDILVYYKIINRDDNMKFEDGNWQLMTKIKNSDNLYSYHRNETYEYVFAPGVQNSNVAQGSVLYHNLTGQTFDEFNQFAIKVVLVTTDRTFCPYVSDLRCVAMLKNR